MIASFFNVTIPRMKWTSKELGMDKIIQIKEKCEIKSENYSLFLDKVEQSKIPYQNNPKSRICGKEDMNDPTQW